MPAQLEKMAEEAKREGKNCRRYLFLRGGQTVREVWATPWEELGSSGPSLRRAIADLGELYRLMGQPYADVKSASLAELPIFASPPHLFTELARLDAFPVLFTHLARRKTRAGNPLEPAERKKPGRDRIRPADRLPAKSDAQLMEHSQAARWRSLRSRFFAFIVEKYPLALGLVQESMHVALQAGLSLQDAPGLEAEIAAVRPHLRRQLELRIDETAVAELPETSPGIEARERLIQAAPLWSRIVRPSSNGKP